MADSIEQRGTCAGRAPARWKEPSLRSRVASAPSGALETDSRW